MLLIRKILLAGAGAATVLMMLLLAAGDAVSVEADSSAPANSETKEISQALRNPSDANSLLMDDSSASVQSFSTQAATTEAAVGDQARWVSLNDTGSFYYTKTYELRAQDASGEVWIAVGEGRDPDGALDGITGLNFPAGDCRNDGVRNVVTDAQAEYLLDQYTNQIKPTDEGFWGPPVYRDGSSPDVPLPRP
ncbi:MAG: hypothetical protein ABI559_04060, partial [Chloroflexota bacterium]